ncbi:hypothetical protein EV363DRAFT_1182840, partial [Boletus edulis]
NNVINGRADAIYLVVNDMGLYTFTSSLNSSTGATSCIEHFYGRMYDTSHGAVGFAKTTYTCVDIS